MSHRALVTQQLEQARTDLQRMEKLWSGYSGNSHDKVRADLDLARSRVTLLEDLINVLGRQQAQVSPKVKSPVEEEPYREKRGTARYSMPTLMISIDDKRYLTKNWSLSGALLSNYFGRRSQGEEIYGDIGVITKPERHPFKGITARRDVVRRELASPPGPAPRDLVLLANPGFILPPKLYPGTGR